MLLPSNQTEDRLFKELHPNAQLPPVYQNLV